MSAPVPPEAAPPRATTPITRAEAREIALSAPSPYTPADPDEAAPLAAPAPESGTPTLEQWEREELEHYATKSSVHSPHTRLWHAFVAMESRLAALTERATRAEAALREIAAITQPLTLLLAIKQPVSPKELMAEAQHINRLIRAALPSDSTVTEEGTT
jgi:hypothetical protein